MKDDLFLESLRQKLDLAILRKEKVTLVEVDVMDRLLAMASEALEFGMEESEEIMDLKNEIKELERELDFMARELEKYEADALDEPKGGGGGDPGGLY